MTIIDRPPCAAGCGRASTRQIGFGNPSRQNRNTWWAWVCAESACASFVTFGTDLLRRRVSP